MYSATKRVLAVSVLVAGAVAVAPRAGPIFANATGETPQAGGAQQIDLAEWLASGKPETDALDVEGLAGLEPARPVSASSSYEPAAAKFFIHSACRWFNSSRVRSSLCVAIVQVYP